MTTELLLALGVPSAYLLISTLLLLQRPQSLPPSASAPEHPQSNRLEHNGGTLHHCGGTAVGVESVMHNPLLMLVPWLVFAVGAGLMFWRLTTVFRQNLGGTPTKTERFRQSLERIWQKGQKTM